MQVEGDLDVDSAYRVYEGVAALFDDAGPGLPRPERPRRVLIDLSGVTFIDSVGLGMLIRSEEEARRNDAALVLRSPSDSVRRLLSITAMDRNFAIS